MEWPMVRLGAVLREEREPVGCFDGEGLTVFGVTNIKGVTQTGIDASEDKSKYLRLRPNRFVYNPYRVNVGSLGLTTSSQNGLASPAYVIFRTTDSLNSRYLYYFLKSRRGNQLINFYGNRGTVRAALRFPELCQIEIPLPPLSEQRRTVVQIEQLVAKIDEAQRLKKQTMQEAEAICFSILTIGQQAVPTQMGALLRLREPDVIVRHDETYQFAGVYSFGRGVFRAQIRGGTEFAYTRLTRLHAGDFVYPKLMAWEGALAIVPEECDGCVVSTEFPVFEVDKTRVLPEVLDTYFRNQAVWPEISGASIGTNVRRRRLNPKDFLSYKMPLPSMATQERLHKIATKLKDLRRLHDKSVTELNALLSSVLDKAFKGEL